MNPIISKGLTVTRYHWKEIVKDFNKTSGQMPNEPFFDSHDNTFAKNSKTQCKIFLAQNAAYFCEKYINMDYMEVILLFSVPALYGDKHSTFQYRVCAFSLIHL